MGIEDTIKKYIGITDVLHDLIRDFVIVSRNISKVVEPVKEIITAGARIVNNLVLLIRSASPKLKESLKEVANSIEKWTKELNETLKLPEPAEIEGKVRILQEIQNETNEKFAINIVSVSSVLKTKSAEEVIQELPEEAQEEMRKYLDQLINNIDTWKKANFSEKEAIQWQSYGFTVKQAIAWRRLKLSPELANQIRREQVLTLINH